MIEVDNIVGIEDYVQFTEPLPNDGSRLVYKVNDKAFLIQNQNTIEIRCDEKLSRLLIGKYESVMESRYFGRGGIEIVCAGRQLKTDELSDLIRLSYNLTKN